MIIEENPFDTLGIVLDFGRDKETDSLTGFDKDIGGERPETATDRGLLDKFWIIFGSLKILISKFVSIMLPCSMLFVNTAYAVEAATATSTPTSGNFSIGFSPADVSIVLTGIDGSN